MLDCKTLPGFADVDSRLPNEPDVRIAVQLLVMQAFSAGQSDGLARGQSAAEHAMADLTAKLLALDLQRGA